MEVETSGRFIVALRVVASESSVDQSASLIDTDTSAVAADDVVHTRVDIRTTEDHLTHLLTVTRGHTDRYGQFLCNLGWHTDFVHAEVWIWGDHRPSTEVDTLTGQVASESSFLTFQSLSQRLEGSSGAVTCWWDTRCLVVEVGRHVVLEKFPKVLNNQLWGTRVTVFTKSLVDSENVNEFVGQVVFGAVTAVEGNRRADGDWRYGEHLQHNPLWAVLLVHSNEDEVVGWDSTEPLTDVTRVELAPSFVLAALALCFLLFLEGRRLVKCNLALCFTTVHADTTAGAGGDLLNFLDDLGEFC